MVRFYSSVIDERLVKKNGKYYVSGIYGPNKLRFFEDLDNYILVNKCSEEVLFSNIGDTEEHLKDEEFEEFSKNIIEMRQYGNGIYFGIIRKRKYNQKHEGFRLDLNELITYIVYNEYYDRVCFEIDSNFFSTGQWYVEDKQHEETLELLKNKS